VTQRIGFLINSIAGAQGELAALLMMRAYQEDQVEGHRSQILIPDSAHGTNPASTTMAGLSAIQIPSDEHGNIHLVHGCGGLVYGDGANMNALTGVVRWGDLGVDLMHYNLLGATWWRGARETPKLVLEAPHHASVGRLDEVRAARKLTLREELPRSGRKDSCDASS